MASYQQINSRINSEKKIREIERGLYPIKNNNLAYPKIRNTNQTFAYLDGEKLLIVFQIWQQIKKRGEQKVIKKEWKMIQLCIQEGSTHHLNFLNLHINPLWKKAIIK